MNRFAALVAGIALLSSTGCMHDGEWSVSKALGWDDEPSFDPKNPPKASLPTAERVEVLGRKIIVQNTFTGIEPLIFTVGVKESVLFHRGTEQLYISEGLVNKCKTDAELAAVLCAELGQMVAEKRAAKSVGRDVDPIKDAGFGGSPVLGGGTPVDAGQQANLAFHEKRFPRGNRGVDAADASQAARDLLKGSGFDPADLERVEPLLKQSDRGEKIRKQMGSSAAAPDWKK
ncbi:hypothetical protein J8F10_31525 [Gemmata sp. G18]|uniref:Lipoprotein n=1 Tax=Gemmata palustris TaxID=2822762 RepID=A0ABS5C1F9_9BACT|nr:hypothetical protein [Gemmata palustris]MBP3959801.1 hypothetical protein [Gemmata palustris]